MRSCAWTVYEYTVSWPAWRLDSVSSSSSAALRAWSVGFVRGFAPTRRKDRLQWILPAWLSCLGSSCGWVILDAPVSCCPRTRVVEL